MSIESPLGHLPFLVEEFRDKGKTAKNVDNDEHKAIPPTGMFAVDGTKMA